jgi:predicted metalloprotease with PDZ domain
MYALNCDVPAGASTIQIALDFVGPAAKEGFSSAASATAQLAVLNWNQLLLYPKGKSIQELHCRTHLTLPAGWKLGTALPIVKQAGTRTSFAPVSLETLVDSPVLCGLHLREIPIGPDKDPHHFIVVACDSEAGLEMSPELKAHHDRLVVEAGALFGARHYPAYHFLLTLSDQVAHFGLEHHQCSDDRTPERMLIDDDLRKSYATLLPHEFTHSWNGKYRRPADMVTTDFQEPMRTRLLWVYEGLTQYLGVTLAVRSGLWTPQDYHDKLALIAEWAHNQRGRSWRPLEDTTVAAQLLYAARSDWASWRRSVDFYDEGVLLWLEVDTLIRQQTKGKRSLDDFCRRFYGGESGRVMVKPYTFDDIVTNLNAVAPYDWKELLIRRLTATAEQAPLQGIERGGWRLTYADTPSELQKVYEKEPYEKAGQIIDLTSSIGITIKDDGSIIDIIAGKPADEAGIGPGMKLVAVNSRHYSLQLLRTALAATKKGTNPVELLLENGDFFRTYKLDYKGGEKYPHLERDAAKADLLADIIKPLAPAGAETKPAAPK